VQPAVTRGPFKNQVGRAPHNKRVKANAAIKSFRRQIMSKSASHSVYVFKVALKNAKRIWRRIAVRSDQTLHHLHEAIYMAFDREEEHLYSFYFPRAARRGRAWLRDAIEYTHPFNLEKGNLLGDPDLYNAADTTLDRLGLAVGQEFEYLFDCCDEWWHEIVVEQVDGAMDEGSYPRILQRQGRSPRQY